jgi:hypothetical protein
MEQGTKGMYYRTSHKNASRAAGLLRKLTLSALAASLLALPLAGAARAQSGGSATLSKPRLISNGKKYRDAGLPAATGRSGAATLTARALLGKDGQTSFELTTGALDSSAPAPGNITKAQLKPLSSTGEAAYARNFTGLAGGGTFNTTVNDLRRGQQVQAQANVAGVDPNRTGVVTVVETVKLRPDLSAVGLSAPGRAVVNTAVHLSAIVRERHGDTGARANVVLYVDGQAVDRAEGVWVDAGGVVSAAFTHTFATEGVKRLEARVEGVTPGDYDAADNAAAASVEIVSPRTKLNYAVFVSDRHFSDGYKSDYEFNYNDGTVVSRDASAYSYERRAHMQNVYFYGWSYAGALKFPLNVSVKELSDGQAVAAAAYHGIEPDVTHTSENGAYRFTGSTSYRQDSATGFYILVTSYTVRDAEQGLSTDFTELTYARQAGDVTYYSAGTFSQFFAVEGQTHIEFSYSYNNVTNEKEGAFLPFGSEHGLDVSVVGADGAEMSAAPRMTLSTGGYSNSSNNCWEYSYGAASGRNCYEEFVNFEDKFGGAFEHHN